ncbi:carbohydrate-binding module family 1 protein [Hypholoma sublateritium FD-334 SS-4]|uniref:Carbohydrate-binding module family 1 protein n=1 Tax=Hypholoma sublateritium (strain FD-334 SS-4) TaxID=945553 RepID=A0A0D2L457_HYPSF|nr:carbohydrate-binding module family 1 protein [Hypholoma sublateritium FD-334 SS-4]
MIVVALLFGFSLAGRAFSQISGYGQCGGIGWSGGTTCVSGWVCTYSNPYFSQCLRPSTTATPSTTSTSTKTSTTVITTSKSTPLSTTATSSAPIATASPWGQCGGQGYNGPTVCSPGWICTVNNAYFSNCYEAVPTGLAANYTFIRADNDESYIQAADPSTVSPLLLTTNPYTAAQCQITAAGQLIQNATGTTLYADVSPPASSNATELFVSWSTLPSTNGLFSISNGTIAWSSPTFSTPTSAWIVCNGGPAYINYNYTYTADCYAENLFPFGGSS